MKKSVRSFKKALTVVFSLLIMAPLDVALGQIYSFSAPISGGTEVDLSFGTGSVGGGGTSFGTLNETLYYDPVAQTLRQVGSVTVNTVNIATPMYFVVYDPRRFDGHNPPTGTANLTIGDGSGIVSFDTGIQSITQSCDWTLGVPVSGLCTFAYNGQTNSGPVNYSVNLYLDTQILSADSSSLTLSEGYNSFADYEAYAGTVGGFDLYDGTDDGTYHYSWNVGPITALAVPEPGSSQLLCLAMPVLVFLCRNRYEKLSNQNEMRSKKSRRTTSAACPR